MADFASSLVDAKVDSLHKIVQNGRQKYLCFTKVNESTKAWLIEVSDGIDIWFLELDQDDLETQKDLNNTATTDAFFTRIRNGFSSGDLSVARVGTKLTLTIGKGASTISLDLFEAKAAEKKNEFQAILFRLAENCSHLETQLATANQQVETLKAQKATGRGLDALMDLSPKKGPGQNKAKQNKAGMSVVNPTSRKRKAAAGVVFGD